jgi:PST family polysaccharide transporter
MRPLLGFGGWTSMFGIVNYVSRNADNALIGRYEGAADLGVYSRAYQLLLLPLQQVNAPLARVAIPTLSRLQDEPARYRRFYETAMAAIAYVTLPLVAVLAVLADEIVVVLLGTQWREAAPIFQVLAFAGIGMTLGQANGWLYQTTGHARRQALSGLVSRGITVASFVVGIRWGAYGVAVAFTVSTTLLTIPSFALATLGAPVSMRGIGRAIWRPAVVAVATYAVASLLHHALDPHVGSFLVLVGTCLGTLAAYAAMVAAWPAARAHWREIAALLRPGGGTKRG